MERITEFDKERDINKVFTSEENNIEIGTEFNEDGSMKYYVSGAIIDRLAQYEDTGLEPEEIKKLLKNV